MMDFSDGNNISSEGYNTNSNETKMSSHQMYDVTSLASPKMIVRNYEMNNKKRGFALIFNHENFNVQGETVKKRNATDIDCETLKSSLEGLGFVVSVFKDLIFLKIYQKLQKFSRKDHSKNDCFLVVVLTHGTKGKLYASDKCYGCEELWSPFYSSNCPTLQGKPKLFIVQACQGGLYDDGVLLCNDNGYNGLEDSSSVESLMEKFHVDKNKRGEEYFAYKPLEEPDFLLAFSSPPDYFSWRHSENGSWFIKELCKELDENGYKQHLLELLTSVCRHVATEYKSYTEDKDYSGKVQVPFLSHTLLRICQFTKKRKGCSMFS